MVVTDRPSAWTASMVQLLTERPSTWTTQAPHWLVSQPTWVPVSPRCSRSNCTRRVRPSTSRVTDLPLTFKETDGIALSLFRLLDVLDAILPLAGWRLVPPPCATDNIYPT